MNKIIEELIKNGIPVTCEYNSKTEQIEYVVNGFYKSGEIRLIDDKNNGSLSSYGRYNEIRVIFELRDIVELNYDWWQYSKDRFDGWKNPDGKWIPLLEKFELITKKVETVTTWV